MDAVLRALFGEAWDLQRRRRRRYLVYGLAILVLAGAMAVLRGGPAPRSESQSPGAARAQTVASVRLPRSGGFSSLAVIGGHLLVWSSHDGSIDSAPVASISPGPAAGGGTCRAAQVDPSTLALVTVRRGACADPALYHERVLLDLVNRRGGATGSTVAMHVSVVARGTRAGYRVGPALVSYAQCSDCGATWTYGAGALWVYVPYLAGHLAPGTQRGELMRISPATGQVLQRWVMPSLPRALLASDADGLWIAPSMFSGSGWLYRVAAGMARPQRALRDPSGAAWLIARGSNVWLELGGTGVRAPDVIQLRGSGAVQVASRKVPGAGMQCFDGGEGPSGIAASAGGVDCLGLDGTGAQAHGAVYRVSAGTVALSKLAAVSLPRTTYQFPAQAVGGAFFFLVPPNFSYPAGDRPAVAQSAGRLYRVG